MITTRLLHPGNLPRPDDLPSLRLQELPAPGDTERASMPMKRTGFVVLQLDKAGQSPEADAADALDDVLKLAQMVVLSDVLKSLGQPKGRRLITSVSPKRLREMEERAERSAFPPLRSLRGYWLLDLRGQPEAIDAIVKRLSATPGVAQAYGLTPIRRTQRTAFFTTPVQCG